MTELTERRYEIQTKIEKEANNLTTLTDLIEKSNQLTQGMVAILSSFELRLGRLEQTILPVYNETGNLQRKQNNMERTLAALDHVIGFYGVSQEVAVAIRSGPRAEDQGGGGLDAFLSAMDRLQAARDYFEKHNPSSVELENVITLFDSGGDALYREFKELLFKHSKPVPSLIILDLVSADEESSGEDSPASLRHFPEDVGPVMQRLTEWLIVHGRDEFMNVYARVRAQVLLKSLQQLKDQQRSASGGSSQGIPAASSPMLRQKFQIRHDPPIRRASKRLQHVLEKKANKMLLKASQTLEHSTGLTLGPRRTGLHLEAREDVVDENEMENLVVCVVALQRLMSSERQLMIGIIPLQHMHHFFQIIIKDALDLVVHDGESIASRAKRCISRHEFAAVLAVFPILKQLVVMKPEFDRTVEGCDAAVRSKFSSIFNTLHATGAKALEDFIESIRTEPSTQLPRDGTVHELTSNVLVFLEQLLEYVDQIGNVLREEVQYRPVLAKASAGADPCRVLLGSYIRKVLQQLMATLLSKSEMYSEPGLRAVFRLNNGHYVVKALQRAGLLDLVKLTEPRCENEFLQDISNHKKEYQQCWNKVLGNIWPIDENLIILQGGKIRDKDRATIKEKFAGFNKDMEEIAKVQRGYSIPDVELREGLKRDNKEYILPKYDAFYQKFSTVQFTKNPEKYIKYTPEQVSALIDRFFDVAA